MPIIDNTYFQALDLYTPNNKDVSAQPVGTPSDQSALDLAIDKYECELLLNAFGVTLYNELKTANENRPFTGKWKDLVDGKDYTIGGGTYRWDGLKGYNKQSLIAFYVNCQMIRINEATRTTKGYVVATPKGSVNFSPRIGYVHSWMDFLDQYQNKSIGVKSSLYQYLCHANELDPTAFPDFEFKLYQPLNRFGL